MKPSGRWTAGCKICLEARKPHRHASRMPQVPSLRSEVAIRCPRARSLSRSRTLAHSAGRMAGVVRRAVASSGPRPIVAVGAAEHAAGSPACLTASKRTLREASHWPQRSTTSEVGGHGARDGKATTRNASSPYPNRRSVR